MATTPEQRIARIPDIISTALEHGWEPEIDDDEGYTHFRGFRNVDGASLNLDNDGTDSCWLYVTRKENDDGRSYLFCRYELTLGEAEEVAALSPAELRCFLDGRDSDLADRTEYSEKEVMDNFNDRRGAVLATRAKGAANRKNTGNQ